MKITFTFLCLLAFTVTGICKDSYTENKGQIITQDRKLNTAVLYLFNGKGLNLQLRQNGFSYDVWQQNDRSDEIKFHRVDIDFVQANSTKPVASGKSPDYLNYYTEYTGQQGAVKIHSYDKVVYKNLWQGVDIEFEIKNGKPKYNFIIHPGAQLQDIQLDIKGADKIETKGNGLLLRTSLTAIDEQLPYSYYTTPGTERKNITTSFTKTATGYYGISTTNAIPANATLVIDPVPTIAWGTFYGGAGQDVCYGTETDAAGYVYTTGATSSSGSIATTGAFQNTAQGNNDGFIVKFTSAGVRIWATYFGGTASDYANSVKVTKSNKHIFITGGTFGSAGLASSNAHQTTFGGGIYDLWLSKFDSAGQRVWSTYYGGAASESNPDVVSDSKDNAYFSGSTSSNNNISTTGAHKVSASSNVNTATDAFIAKFDSAGNRIWATYFGETGSDHVYLAGILNDTSLYITGYTSSATGIASSGSYQVSLAGGTDAFIAKFDSAGTYKWGTYYGGTDDENSGQSVLTGDGYIYFGGETKSTAGIATTGVHQTTFAGLSDGFIAKFDANGQRVWGTYYGGTSNDGLLYLSADAVQNLYVAGFAQSNAGIATPGSLYSTNPNPVTLPIFAKFDKDGNQKWGSYYPGVTIEGIHADNAGDVYVSGRGQVAQVGTPGSHQQFHAGGGTDGFVLKIQGCKPGFAIATGPTSVMNGLGSISLDVNPAGIKYEWSHPNGFTSNVKDPFIPVATHNDSGWYTVYLTDSAGCVDSATWHVSTFDWGNVSSVGNAAIKVYPVPANNVIYIDNDFRSNATISISNMAGQVLYHDTIINRRHVINAKQFAAGEYIIQVLHDGKTSSMKILITP